MADRSHQAIASLIEQLLTDPLVQLVMSADRIDVDEARTMLRGAALRVEISEIRVSDGAWINAPGGEETEWRRGVGIVLFNRLGQIFIGERTDIPGAWQMPQGGIDPGETSYEAALRELREEIGTDTVELLAESQDWLTYELPPEALGQAFGGRYRGQRQKWFAMHFTGEDRDIDIATDHPEFSAWRWASVEDVIDLIVPFKRALYQSVTAEFSELVGLDTRRP